MYKKKKKEKFDCKKKNILLSSLQLQYWKTKIIVFYVKFVSWAFICFG